MALEAVLPNTDYASVISAETLDRLQREQFHHDEQFHREIARLPIQARLKHMALHFAKYAGALFSDPSEDEFRRLVTDTLIIGISSANILNIRLADALNLEIRSKRTEFEESLVVAAGQMAAACEKFDHLEDFAFRPVISEQVLKIVAVALGEFEDRNWEVAESIAQRLLPVKMKSIFYEAL